jgi:hypothetical protein
MGLGHKLPYPLLEKEFLSLESLFEIAYFLLQLLSVDALNMPQCLLP